MILEADAAARRRAIVGTWLAILGAAAALAVTLAPSGEPSLAARGAVRPPLDLRDFILNLGLLAPVGAGLRLRRWRLGAIVAFAFALSSGIELVQLILPIGRDASLLDVVANTAGGGIAAMIVSRALRGLDLSVRGAWSLAAAVLSAWLAQAGMTAWALQRDVPVAPQYYGQWSHVFAGMVPLTGTVTEFAIQGQPIPDDAVPATPALRALLADADTVTVRTVVIGLGPSPGRAQLVGVTNGAGDLVSGFERDHCVIRFRFRTHGERLGLRSQSPRLPTSCDTVSGASVITGRAAHSSLTLAADWGGEVQQATLVLAPTLGWRLFAPLRWRGGGWDTLASMAWMALWGGPLAFLLRVACRRRTAFAALLYAVGLLGGTALVALASGLAAGWPADVLGVLLGWWLSGLIPRPSAA